jgi:hypothetical protein
MTFSVDSADEDADRLYHEFLEQFGLDSVGCQACARALLPAPFNLESYTFTARGGASWTWDVAFARSLVCTRDPRSDPVLLEPHDLASWLEHHSQVDEAHLVHIPADRLLEPVLLAPVPDGQGQVMVDGSHRASVRVRAGLPGVAAGARGATAPAAAPPPTPATPLPPAPSTGSSGARDGQSLAGQSATTLAAFTAVWADRAPRRWVQEHEADLTRLGR